MFKVCSRCGQEYQAWVTECSDCGVPLDLAPGERLAPETRPAAPIEDPVLLRLGEPWELRALAESLQARGISSQIDTYPPGGVMSSSRRGPRGQAGGLGIYVARADVAAVREFTEELAELERSESGAEVVAHDPGACPACGEPTPENAAACSSCGLEFPEVGEDTA